MASERLGLDFEILPREPLPPPVPKPFFSLLDRALSRELAKQIQRPFWIDTVGRSNLVEIRIDLGNSVLRVLAHRNSAYASNSPMFILWMIGTSLVLLGVAVAPDPVLGVDVAGQHDEVGIDPRVRKRTEFQVQIGI